jgi:hypothetical protein
VSRPDATIGLIALVPTRPMLDLFEIFTRYAPGAIVAAESPLWWGSEQHVRQLFADRVKSLSLEHRSIEPSPLADLEFLKAHHPAFVALYHDLADHPDRAAALDRELAELARRSQRVGQELLLVIARKRGD